MFTGKGNDQLEDERGIGLPCRGESRVESDEWSVVDQSKAWHLQSARGDWEGVKPIGEPGNRLEDERGVSRGMELPCRGENRGSNTTSGRLSANQKRGICEAHDEIGKG